MQEAPNTLSRIERLKGYIRPYRRAYRHIGEAKAGEGVCWGITTMVPTIAEVFAKNPKFYGSAFCVKCGRHRSVSEFVWEEDREVLGS